MKPGSQSGTYIMFRIQKYIEKHVSEKKSRIQETLSLLTDASGKTSYLWKDTIIKIWVQIFGFENNIFLHQQDLSSIGKKLRLDILLRIISKIWNRFWVHGELNCFGVGPPFSPL